MPSSLRFVPLLAGLASFSAYGQAEPAAAPEANLTQDSAYVRTMPKYPGGARVAALSKLHL